MFRFLKCPKTKHDMPQASSSPGSPAWTRAECLRGIRGGSPGCDVALRSGASPCLPVRPWFWGWWGAPRRFRQGSSRSGGVPGVEGMVGTRSGSIQRGTEWLLESDGVAHAPERGEEAERRTRQRAAQRGRLASAGGLAAGRVMEPTSRRPCPLGTRSRLSPC